MSCLPATAGECVGVSLSTGAGRTRAEVYYSYKSNPARVLQLLHGLGIGAEVISEYELWLALKLGVPANRIVFNGPAKSTAAIHDAVAQDSSAQRQPPRRLTSSLRPRAGWATPSYRHTCRRLLRMERAVQLSIGQGEAFAAIKCARERRIAAHRHPLPWGGMLRARNRCLGTSMKCWHLPIG